MSYRFSRRYCGPLQAIVFDWAGTLIDYGSFAPVAAFVDVFKKHGITITPAQARGPMGTHKRDHIRSILKTTDATWTERDVDGLYEAFLPVQLATLPNHSQIIPGVLATLDLCRLQGLKLGSTTGYTREIMEALVPLAARQGMVLDSVVNASETKAGRPAPWMCFKNAENLGVYPMESMLKVGDTIVDIGEGLNAGMWTVGITLTGNEIGLSEAEASKADLASKLESAKARFYAAGAHYVAQSVAELPKILDLINARLARGETP